MPFQSALAISFILAFNATILLAAPPVPTVTRGAINKQSAAVPGLPTAPAAAVPSPTPAPVVRECVSTAEKLNKAYEQSAFKLRAWWNIFARENEARRDTVAVLREIAAQEALVKKDYEAYLSEIERCNISMLIPEKKTADNLCTIKFNSPANNINRLSGVIDTLKCQGILNANKTALLSMASAKAPTPLPSDMKTKVEWYGACAAFYDVAVSACNGLVEASSDDCYSRLADPYKSTFTNAVNKCKGSFSDVTVRIPPPPPVPIQALPPRPQTGNGGSTGGAGFGPYSDPKAGQYINGATTGSGGRQGR